MGEGLRGSNGACSLLCRYSVTTTTTHNQIGPFWCWFLCGWVCVCSGTLWVSPMNSPVRLGVSPTASSTPIGVFSQRFEALFPHNGTLGLQGLLSSLFVPLGLSSTSVGPQGLSATASRVRQLQPCLFCSTIWCLTAPPALSAQLPVSSPPTGLNECFFFISLVVRLPYSLIFCQFCF